MISQFYTHNKPCEKYYDDKGDKEVGMGDFIVNHYLLTN